MAAPIKVLYMVHDSRRSGVPAVVANFVGCAATVGVEPTLLFAYDGVYAQELRGGGIPVITLGGRTPFFWRAKRFLMNGVLLARAKRFDVIHVHSVKLAWSVLFGRLLGARVVFHLHELPRRIGWVLRKAISSADAVVFCSAACAAHFAGVPAKRRRTIVNGLRFSDSPPIRHDGVGKRVVMVGSINRNKGQDLLLRAFARLRNREAELWLYGTTGLSARRYVRGLKQYAEKQGVAERVFFPGPTADVHQVFAHASVVVHPSWTESFGMALVEAMSCGVPVVAHDLEGMREVIDDGVTGFLVKAGDIDALATRIDELLENPGLRAQMGGAAYRTMRERFSITSRADEYRELYEEVCRR